MKSNSNHHLKHKITSSRKYIKTLQIVISFLVISALLILVWLFYSYQTLGKLNSPANSIESESQQSRPNRFGQIINSLSSNSTPQPTSTPASQVKPSLKPTATTKPTSNISTPKPDLTISEFNIVPYPHSTYPPQDTSFSLEERNPNPGFGVLAIISNSSSIAAGRLEISLSDNNVVIDKVQLDSLGAGDNYRYGYYFGSSLGEHRLKITVTLFDSQVDANLTNNTFTRILNIIPETQPPVFDLTLVKQTDTQSTCIDFFPSDNLSDRAEMTYFEKLDQESYANITHLIDPSVEIRYNRCVTGPAGEPHTYTLKISDKRGNTTEKSIDFQLYSF